VGSVATLLAAFCTSQTSKLGRGLPVKALACFPPVFINAVFIGALIAWYMVGGGIAEAFFPAFLLSGLQVGFGQAVVLYAIGLPLMVYLPKSKAYGKLMEYYGE